MNKETLIGQLGLRLSSARSLPEGEPKAVVVLLHGYAEHIGRYLHVIEALNKHDYVVFTLDHRGHGESEGQRACVEKFAYFVDDLHLLLLKAKEAFPNLPLFMIGHSMGGLIAILYALRHEDQVDGLVLSGAALQIGDDVSRLLKAISKYVVKLVPNLPILSNQENVLSRDPAIERRFKQDSLCYNGKIKARMAYEMKMASEDVCARMSRLSLPLLIMHGSADRLTNPAGSKRLYQQARSQDKTLKLWPEHFHEIFNELEKEQVIAFMLEWLDKRAVTINH